MDLGFISMRGSILKASYNKLLHATNKELIFKWGLASFFIFIGTPNGKAKDAQ